MEHKLVCHVGIISRTCRMELSLHAAHLVLSWHATGHCMMHDMHWCYKDSWHNAASTLCIDALCSAKVSLPVMLFPVPAFAAGGFTQHQLAPQIVTSLTSRGQVLTSGPFSLGVSQAISVSYSSSSDVSQPADLQGAAGTAGVDAGRRGLLLGYSDARKDGAPLGY
jgi:hypothetical protein